MRERERERGRNGGGIGRRSRGEGEENGNGGEKAEFRLFRKLIIRPPILFSDILNFSLSLSLSLSLTSSRELDESFVSLCVPRHTFEFHREGEGGGGFKNIPPVWRRACIIDASYARYI